MIKKYCVCTEQASGSGGGSYSLCIVKKFDIEQNAADYIESGKAGFADFYYIMEIWFRE